MLSRLTRILGFLLLQLVTSCEGTTKGGQPTPPGPRQQAEAQLQRAIGLSGPEADDLRWQAANGFEALWRAGGAWADGLKAADAFDSVESGPQHCRARLRGATLRAELTGDLLGAVRKITVLRELPNCRNEAQAVLQTLSAAALDQAPDTPRSAPQPMIEPSDEPSRVVKVERYGSRDSARIVVFLSAPSEYEVGALPPNGGAGSRLFVDIRGASYAGPVAFNVGGLVERVRLGQREDGVRVVLDLREAVRERVFYLPEPFRLVLDVSRAVSGGANVSARGVSRVVLDPGHGGYDPGAIGPSGLQEKDVALDVAHRAAPLIARELQISTMLTRDADEFVPLDERVAKANAFGADLFISIHCNASESAESHGVMTFVLDSGGDAMARRLAARENAVSEEAAQRLARTLRSLMDADAIRQSQQFAELLQRGSMASLKPHFPAVTDGGVRRAGFFVLAGAQMPAVLLETSFISNPSEEQWLDSAVYRQKLADGLVNAIRAFQERR